MLHNDESEFDTLSVTARTSQTRACEAFEIGACVLRQSNLTAILEGKYLLEANKQKLVH